MMMSGGNATNSEVTDRLREAMPIAKKWAYFDHAAVAPISQPAADAIGEWLGQATTEGDTLWLEWARKLGAARTVAASLIGAQEMEIALVPNTTAGINLVAEGMDWQVGDNVVTLDDEFPSNLYPWLHLERQGVETRRVPTTEGRLDIDQLADHCDERTRVVSISWVGYANGCRRDVKAVAEVAHHYGALFLLDAIQGLGVFPLNVVESGVDVLAADGHKWLLGPEGAGIAYISKDWLPRLKPIGVGWNSVKNAADFTQTELHFKRSAARYEGGSYNMAGFLGLGASLELLTSLGVEHISSALLDYTDYACQRLVEMGALVWSPRNGQERSGIISFEMPGKNPNEIRKRCLTQGVAFNCRAGRLRISPHAYNTEADLDKLLNVLQNA